MRRLSALQQFRRGEGEVTKLLLVDGRDQWVINGREVRLLLCEIWVKVVDVLWRFLEGDNEELLSICIINSSHTIVPSMSCHVTYNPRLERWLNFSTIQLLPVDAGEEGVAGHCALSAL